MSARDWVQRAALVVDDDEAVRVVACGLLGSLGFDVLTAADGVEAVEVFRLNQERIAMVLLDVTMPRLDGIGALRELRRIRPEVRVILCTGYSEEAARTRLGDLASEELLEKPFDLDRLRERLGAVLTD
jgi:CheY-like chemotaxis protein